MAHKPAILMPDGQVNRPALPKIKGIHPHGSKILVEVLRADEILGTKFSIDPNTTLDGAPQAYVVDLGPSVPEDAGINKGDRIYWTGKGTQVVDPNTTTGRVRALLEMSNVLAIIDEDK